MKTLKTKEKVYEFKRFNRRLTIQGEKNSRNSKFCIAGERLSYEKAGIRIVDF